MTTEAAAKRYLALHELEWAGKPYAVYNPHNKPLEELPIIYGFNNGGRSDWYYAVAIAEDGHVLGSHLCSHEGYMRHDLGILEGSRPDRHKDDYQPHYPDGYRMTFVETDRVDTHPGLNAAVLKNQEMAAEKDSAAEVAAGAA